MFILMDCLFCDFVSGKKKNNRNGFPFRFLHEMDHTVSFLSIDFPATQDGHTLVISKKHFSSLEDIPFYIQKELLGHVSLVGKALKKRHEGYNVLLNNGKSAGQYVSHTHFHVVPRNKGDQISIEDWNRKKMTKKRFLSLQKELRKTLHSL